MHGSLSTGFQDSDVEILVNNGVFAKQLTKVVHVIEPCFSKFLDFVRLLTIYSCHSSTAKNHLPIFQKLLK